MHSEALTAEAEHCREIAAQFSGKPEEPFLLRLASALEELALIQKRIGPWTVHAHTITSERRSAT